MALEHYSMGKLLCEALIFQCDWGAHCLRSSLIRVGCLLNYFDGLEEAEDLEHTENLDDSEHAATAIAPGREVIWTVLGAKLGTFL